MIMKKIKVEMDPTTSFNNPQIIEKNRETVPQYLMKRMGIEEERLSFLFKRDLNTINNLLNGKQLTALYGKKPINFVYGGLTMTGANRTFAFMRGPTVEKYIKKKQQITLKHPEWPCLIQQGGGDHKTISIGVLLLLSAKFVLK
ncbi:hypothetical protein Mgra_00002589 [Meloidogyne graminicola]|uniref:Uncharacterized protein n=1 Tax=Meloidogyne graminicola TaxID=189291 RepID=A0A8S9ZXJ7_9BILA|nr:hypothetical protein Mgra_00002589 [Meloidogyne graminicola]